MNIRWIKIIQLTLTAILFVAFVGCTGVQAGTVTSIQLTDGLGRTVTLAQPAKRIVSLAPSNTEILFTIKANDQIVGRDDFSDYPAEASTIPSIGGLQSFSTEKIVSLQPDLVLAAGINSKEQVKSLEDLNLTVYYLPNPKDFEGLYANIQTVGVLTGRQDEAATLNADLRKRVTAIEEKIPQTGDRPKVFYEIDATDPSKPWTSGPDTFMDLLINKSGGENIGRSLTSSWAQISQEAVVYADPDILLLGDAAYGVTPETVSTRPGWETIKAVKNNQIYTFDDNLVSRPGPRLVDGFEILSAYIHP